MRQDAHEQTSPVGSRDRFIGRVAIVGTAAGLLFLAGQARGVWIVGFGGIVVAVVLCSLADISRHGAARPLAVLIATVLAAVLGIFGWIATPHIGSQWRTLVAALPTSLYEIDRIFGGWLPEDEELNGAVMRDLAARAAAWSGMLMASLTNLVLGLGLFLSVSPGRYSDAQGVAARQAHLDGGHRRRGDDRDLARRPHRAVRARPDRRPLRFVPIVGPIAAAVPGLLLALTISPATVMWTALAYFAIEQLESNFILPFFEGEMVDLPRALLILSFAILGALFGHPRHRRRGTAHGRRPRPRQRSLYVRPMNTGATQQPQEAP